MIEKHLLPEGERYFIAGGFAACPALANDVDVWVESSYYNPELSRKKLLEHLMLTYGVLNITVEETGETCAYSDIGESFQTMKVASLRGDNGVRYHIMVTTGDVLQVLHGFDISTHQVAITSEGVVVTGDDFTKTSEPPRVLRDTPSTPERLIKITQRYAAYQPVESVF